VPTIVLILATLTSGLVAGVYAFYAHTVMPGLGRAGDRTFVAGFQALDRAIVNPWFMVSAFLGAPVLAAVAALLHVGDASRGVLLWVVVSLVLDLVTVGITVGSTCRPTTGSRRPGMWTRSTLWRRGRSSTRVGGPGGIWCALCSAWWFSPPCCGPWCWRDAWGDVNVPCG